MNFYSMHALAGGNFFYTASKKQKNKCLKRFDDVGWAAGRTSGL